MFNDYFEIYLADTLESQELHFNIRYKVYCEELGYEDKALFPEQQEIDKWDKHSVHFLLRYKVTGQWVGAVRLVFRDDMTLPMEEVCVVEEINCADGLQNPNLVEVSRLCLLSAIRKRQGEQRSSAYPDVLSHNSEVQNQTISPFYSSRKIKQNILFSLLHAAAQYSIDNQINDWYWLGTEALARILRKSGLVIDKMGDACEHRGTRFPYKMYPVQTFMTLSKYYKQPYALYSECYEHEYKSAV